MIRGRFAIRRVSVALAGGLVAAFVAHAPSSSGWAGEEAAAAKLARGVPPLRARYRSPRSLAAVHAGAKGAIQFVSDREGGPGVYAINADGSGLRKLISNAGDPEWSRTAPGSRSRGTT